MCEDVSEHLDDRQVTDARTVHGHQPLLKHSASYLGHDGQFRLSAGSESTHRTATSVYRHVTRTVEPFRSAMCQERFHVQIQLNSGRDEIIHGLENLGLHLGADLGHSSVSAVT